MFSVFQNVLKYQRADVWMNSQPKSGVLIELRLARLSVVSDSRRQQLVVTLTFRWSSVGIDDRLHHTSRAQNRGRTKRQDVFCSTTLGLVSFSDYRTAGLELLDVVFKDRLRNRNQTGDVVVSRAGTRLNVGQVRSSAGFGTKAEKEQIDAAQRLESFNVSGEFGLEILRVSAHGGKTFDLAEELFTEQALEIAHEAQSVIHSQRRQRILSKNVQPSEQRIVVARPRHSAKQPVQCLATT